MAWRRRLRFGRLIRCLVIPICLAFLTSATCAGVQYALTALGTLPGDNYSYANAINNSGQIVGYSYVSGGPAYFGVNPYDVPGTWHAFLYSGGQMTDLGAFGGNDSMASGINDGGEIVGTIVTNSGTEGFSYSAGVETNLGTLGGTNTYAMSINNAGQITGESYTGAKNIQNEPIFHAFIYSSGTMTDLGATGAYPNSQGMWINSGGQIVGTLYSYATGDDPFLYTGGQLSDVSSSTGLNVLTAINDSGEIIGYENSGQAFLYDNGTRTSLGLNTLPEAINDSGQIVGYTYNVNQVYEAMINFNGVTTNLNSLINPALGWNLQQANDINNEGDIVGVGLNPAGYQQAFLLTPIPEPGTVALVSMAAVGLLMFRARRHTGSVLKK